MVTALITGANRGIGLEFCRQLLARGVEVIAACRRPSAELGELAVEVVEGVDLASDEAVATLAATLADRQIDLLVHNAGVMTFENLVTLDLAAIRQQFEVNTLGPLRVTAALRNNLSSGSKLAIVTSRMGSIADNTSGGYYGYRISKAAVNMLGVCLARDLRRAGVAVAILHPGFVRTEMTKGQGMIDPPESVRGLLARIDALTLESSGSFWHSNGEEIPW